MGKQVSEYIDRLKRRIRFLEGRISTREVEKSHHDRAELTALKWVVNYIEETREAANNHQSNWFKKQEGKNGKE